MNGQTTRTHDLLNVEDFQIAETPPGKFTVWAEQLIISGNSRSDVRLCAEYDRHFSLRLSLEEQIDFAKMFEGREFSISGAGFREPVLLHATSSRISSGSPHVAIEARLRAEPLVIDFQRTFERSEAVLVNTPPLFFSGYEPTFELDGVKITMREFPAATELRKQSQHYRHLCVALTAGSETR